ncbi:MAG: DUF2304 family protein [Xanthomonadaceae bacterium]|nr:DUF2304 family protein [Xanthomonadaceae bacterium]
MNAFQWIYAAYVLGLLTWDWFFLKKNAGPSFKLFAFTLALAGGLAVFPGGLIKLSEALAVGRAVDLVIYFVLPILVRELFVNRRRLVELRREHTNLVRELAKQGYQGK